MPEKQELSALIREKYPFPISHAYGYLESRAASEDRYQALLACFEVTLKTITAIALANFMRDIQNNPEMSSVHVLRELLDILRQPLSLGHWQQLLQSTLYPYANRPEQHTVPELVTFYFRVTDGGKIKAQGQSVQMIQYFIQERNKDAHHRNRSQAAAFQRLAELDTLTQKLDEFLANLQFLANYPLFYVGHAEHHGGQWHYQANYAVGNSYPFRQETKKTSLGLNANCCILTNAAQSSILELDPFVIVTSEGRLQQPDLFFFDGQSGEDVRFMNYHVGDYIASSDNEEDPSSVAEDTFYSLIRLLENRLPPTVEEPESHIEEPLTAVDIYRDATRWAFENGERQTITLEALRQILELPREEARQQEHELDAERGVEVEVEEIEIPFEGDPSWANLAYYVLENSGKEELDYKEIAVEAAELKGRYDQTWQKGEAANMAATVSYTMSQDPRFYKARRGYYRLTKNNELLSNPSWANLACFVLQQYDPQRKGMHLHAITDHAVELKEKYSSWRNTEGKTPRSSVSATMGMDHRFESLPKRGYWRLVAEESRPVQPRLVPSSALTSTTRDQAYEQVLARLKKLGEITPLPFGRTYHTLAGAIHLMFRYSKAHQRNGEIEYFLGVTPQYYERIADLGDGYLVFVLGRADNVLLVSTATFADWVKGLEVSGSGTWPLAFYQSEDGTHLERWVPGKGRKDVKTFLNNYDSLQRRLTQPSPSEKDPRDQPMRVSDLLKTGLLRPGDSLYIRNTPASRATVVNDKLVEFQGQQWSYNDWGTHVTGWTSINIYQHIVLARTDQTLNELRQGLQQRQEKQQKE